MRPPRNIIVLLTDFGLIDPYVGVMKGVIKTINQSAQIIDLSHNVPSFNIRAAAIMLLVSHSYFPPGSIFVVVVDPGVGSSRRALLVATRNYYFIGPDNGSLVPASMRDGVEGIWDISDSPMRLPRVSGTFHGRDIFAPVAAYLSLGYRPDDLGARVDDFEEKIVIPRPEENGRCIRGEIIYIDKFGNLMTNIESSHIDGWKNVALALKTHNLRCRILRSFSHAPPGETACYINSWGFLEIGVYLGSAREMLGAEIGDIVEVCPL